MALVAGSTEAYFFGLHHLYGVPTYQLAFWEGRLALLSTQAVPAGFLDEDQIDLRSPLDHFDGCPKAFLEVLVSF